MDQYNNLNSFTLNYNLNELDGAVNTMLGRNGVTSANPNLHSKDCIRYHSLRKVNACHHFNLLGETPCTYQFLLGPHWIEQCIDHHNLKKK
jgi:hypothetical protein